MSVFGERYVAVGSVDAPDGELFDATDSFHARPVALLVRAAGPGVGRDELLARTRALMALPPHPNVSTVRDAFFAGARYVLVMDSPTGRPWPRCWPSAASLACRSRRCWMPGAAGAAVDHLHRQQPPVVHGDVGPSASWSRPQTWCC